MKTRILYWPSQISNAELYERTGTLPISLEVKRRGWRWIEQNIADVQPKIGLHTEKEKTQRDMEEIHGAGNLGGLWG